MSSTLKTSYEEIVNPATFGSLTEAANIAKMVALARQENLRPSGEDSERVLLINIDNQKDFMDGGSLGVPGAAKDVERLSQWIYRNMGGITTIISSLDTHQPFQVFFKACWADENGNPPDDYTLITAADIASGKWHVRAIVPNYVSEYIDHLEQDGKKTLCIWPEHCIKGTQGAAMESNLVNMIYFHSVCRKTIDPMVQKGTDPYSEMYGIIKPEWSRQNLINQSVLTAVEQHDKIYLAGEAASHCLLETGRQILENFAGRPDITRRITILRDCTSPVATVPGGPDWQKVMEDGFNDFQTKYGITVANSTDITL